MQTYIKTEDVEKFARSLIMDSRHLKSAMKDMSIKEENEFIERIVKGNLICMLKFISLKRINFIKI